jgi:ATP-dependent Lon protease
VDKEFFENNQIHLHVPAGATPKDGPSAGITMASCLLSLATERKVKKSLAMTGELSLVGQVLPIGGLKEKLLAAKRAGLKKVVMPEKNRKDLDEVPRTILKGLELVFVDNIDEVVKNTLEQDPFRVSKFEKKTVYGPMEEGYGSTRSYNSNRS